jgi:CheY-like chemotaxis protein
MEVTTKEITFQRKKRIFIVEDERIVAEDLRHRLEENGYEVVGSASTSHVAIEQIKKTLPDLVLMDVNIQGELNGIEVAIIMQSFSENPIPVIFVTGFSEGAFSYLKVLPDYIYVNKPFTESDLLAAVRRALEKAKAQH